MRSGTLPLWRGIRTAVCWSVTCFAVTRQPKPSPQRCMRCAPRWFIQTLHPVYQLLPGWCVSTISAELIQWQWRNMVWLFLLIHLDIFCFVLRWCQRSHWRGRPALWPWRASPLKTCPDKVTAPRLCDLLFSLRLCADFTSVVHLSWVPGGGSAARSEVPGPVHRKPSGVSGDG